MQLLFDIRRMPMQYVAYNGPGKAPAWLWEPTNRPRVCVTWGTLTGGLKNQQRFLLPEIVRAVAKADADVVLAITEADAERLGPLPDGVRVAPQLPLHLLLPSCAAVVHQAGGGTVQTAVRHGVPQIVIPEVNDQPFNAACVAKTGVGVVLEPDRVADAGDIVAGILTDGTHRQAALRLQQEMLARPTPAEVVTTVEELVRAGRR